jgi:phosphate transport system permease protein
MVCHYRAFWYTGPSYLDITATGVDLFFVLSGFVFAPILFTGVAFYLRYLPSSINDSFMAMPYHLYILSTQHHAIEEVRPLAYGTALVLLSLVFVLNIIAFIIRYRYRNFNQARV